MQFMFLDEDSCVPVPKLFHSVYLGRPFEQCVDCETPLLQDEQMYLIHKVFVGTEAVFEMALCVGCMANMRRQYSEETAANLNQYMDRRLSEQQSASESKADEEPPARYTWEDAIRACHLCGRLRETCRRYEISGLLAEDNLFVQRPEPGSFGTPVMICNDCTEQLSKLISRKTRDLWDRFMEDHFPSPPGIEVDDPELRPVLF